MTLITQYDKDANRYLAYYEEYPKACGSAETVEQAERNLSMLLDTVKVRQLQNVTDILNINLFR